MYNEKDYSTAGIITAYALSDITFTQPMRIHKRYLSNSGDFSLSGSSVILPIQKSVGATITEAEEKGTNGSTYKVTVQFSVQGATAADIESVQQLRTAHHLVLTHLGDKLSVIRSTQEGWQYEDIVEEGTLRVKLTIHNVNGQQRVL